MSERTSYPHGVPCWVDTMQPNLKAASEFYASVFGWEFLGGFPRDGHHGYYLARKDGNDVAGIAPLPPMAPDTPAGWITQVRVDNIADTLTVAKRAGADVRMEAFDAAPAGRLAVFSDPGGAVICLWEPQDRQGAQRVNEPSAWAMSVLSSSDPKRSAQFYGQVFGWTTEGVQAGGGEITLFRLPGYIGGEPAQPVSRETVAVMVDGAAGDADYWTVDFWVTDANEALARAERAGGSAVCPPLDSPAGRQAVIRDPAGAVFTVTTAPGQ